MVHLYQWPCSLHLWNRMWCIDVVRKVNVWNLIKVSDEVTFLEMDLFWPTSETLELPWVKRVKENISGAGVSHYKYYRSSFGIQGGVMHPQLVSICLVHENRFCRNDRTHLQTFILSIIPRRHWLIRVSWKASSSSSSSSLSSTLSQSSSLPSLSLACWFSMHTDGLPLRLSIRA